MKKLYRVWNMPECDMYFIQWRYWFWPFWKTMGEYPRNFYTREDSAKRKIRKLKHEGS